jgi:single-stranded DNA-binding protein
MSISALASGTLFRTPEKNGNEFLTAVLREANGTETRWVNIVAFSDVAQAELMRLRPGDSVSIQGPLKTEIYERDGEHRINLTVIADAIFALRRERRSASSQHSRAAPKSEPASKPRQERLAGIWRDENDGPNDDLPSWEGAP